jgi:hypothetical protein
VPKKKDETCVECSKLTAHQARLRHGPKGTSRLCWNKLKCPKRQTYYRKQVLYNAQRRAKYRQNIGQEIINLNIPVPSGSKIELFFYRKKKSVAPHAIVGRLTIGNKIYQDGVHPDKHFSKDDADKFKAQCNDFTLSLFEAFSLQLGKTISGSDANHERSPDRCPICRGDIPEKELCRSFS